MRVVQQVAVISVVGLLTGCGASQSTFAPEPEPVVAAPSGGNGLLPPLPGGTARPAPVATAPLPAAPAAPTPAPNTPTPAAAPAPPPVVTAAAPIAAPAPARSGFTRPPPANGRGMPGQWTLQSSATNQTCALAFYGPAEATAGQAEANCGPASPVTGLSGWSLEGNQLELSKGNDVILVLNQVAPNQYRANAQAGGLATTVTVSR